MKKGLRILFAFIALLGMANCFVLEPALAAHEESVCVSPDGCDDCLVCCSFNHQIIPVTVSGLAPMHAISPFIEINSLTRFDSPSFPIFHPPVVL